MPSGVRKAAKAQQSKPRELPFRGGEAIHVWPKIRQHGLGETLGYDDDDALSEFSQESLVPWQPSYQAYSAMASTARDRSWYGSYIDTAPFVTEKLPEFLDLTPFRDTIFLTFAADNIMKGVRSLPAPPVRDLNTPGGMLDMDCLLSISTSYFGFRHNDQSIVQLGMQRYGMALTELNRALAHPVQSKSPHVLSAVTTMMLYEVRRELLLPVR